MKMNTQFLFKKMTRLTFRQVFYSLAGISLLVMGVIHHDWTTGIVSLLFLYQGVFNTCIFGACAIPKRVANK
jgi:hypothetical protein